jgi:uncharacterized membrane protein YecN with MAPEG domain
MHSISIPITAVFTALLALMLVAISVRVTVLRAKKKISFFDGGDKEMGHALRVQGNFIEYVPLALALLGLMEAMGIRPWFAYTFGAILLVARVVHAWGLYGDVFKARVVGTSVTWLLIAVGALTVLGLVA